VPNTHRRIDTCRDILVGKVPDPKSQVEQITIAMIYKFMDDMDAEAEELGGKRTFFAGEYEKYGWPRLMAPNMGGFDVLALYSEAIQKMNENPGIPSLFRDIFKNAYLPYRDPETLRIFLKEIDGFTYDHSERLGDAFEYLLSVLGSQGDAGQFRTPRHIIDFMVEIIDPKKDESILDPACGTAGFLISAWKHILKSNTKTRSGDLLTPDERKRLAANIKGYDISPDMVRLSLVNMYLHGFTDPHVVEYDTLTSEEKWNEYADIILANPPFMTPKGGIKPHKRFSVQASRSEVLFVDYMAEHLTPNGRAAIIVPEGVIFQSGGAYKQLREMLVKNHLVAVISLPSGVFQPYTGVKTSIIVLDRRRARNLDHILYTEISNIGMSLGIKRTRMEENDLPTALHDYKSFCNGTEVHSKISFAVPKDDIAANDYQLDLKRYRKIEANDSSIKFVSLSEVCTIEKGKSSSTKTIAGDYPLILTAENFGSSEQFDFDCEAVCVPLISSTGHGRASIKRIHYYNGKFALANLLAAVSPQTAEQLDARYLYHVLDAAKDNLAKLMSGAANVTMKTSDLASFEIPLPSLGAQKEIVVEVEEYLKIIDGARQVVENYRPRIAINPAWPMVELEQICEIKSGGTPSRSEPSYWNGTIPWVGSTVCKDCEVASAEEFITDEGLTSSAAKLFPCGTTLIALVGATIGKTALLKFDSTTNQNIAGLYPKSPDVLNPTYLFYAAQTIYPDFLKLGEGKFRMANLSFVREQKIPLPELVDQGAIVDKIEEEQRLINASKELIRIFELKIKITINRMWN
jgi:type I restriction enzyme M protein